MSLAIIPLLFITSLTSLLNAADWPQFRGPSRDGVSKETGLLHQWPAAGPKVLWTVPMAQGYAGASIVAGRVYHEDYDETKFEWSIICRNLSNGKEIWRFTRPQKIRPNHGITRTVPASDGKYVYSIDPKLGLHCLDAKTGKQVWFRNLVADYKTQIPSWYNGQNPLLEPDRLIIATGGDAILAALDKTTGKELWRTPNPNGLLLSHASVMPAMLGGVKQYLYGTLDGPLGIAAKDGALLWSFKRKFNVVAVASPVAIDSERVFMTGPYDAGSVMVRVKKVGTAFKAEGVFDFKNNEWNSEVHTPILYQGNFYGVGKKKRGLFTCMSPDGKPVWDSDGKAAFELGSFLLADGMFFVVEGKSGMLHLLDATGKAYKELGKAQALNGDDVWGPMALSDGKLVIRDMTKMVCLDVRGK